MEKVLMYVETWGNGGIEVILTELIKHIKKSDFNLNLLIAKNNQILGLIY